ncbi:MAG: hypothetical protein ACFFDT_22870, partial [Candidatus Hodarchaeota archaeon]
LIGLFYCSVILICGCILQPRPLPSEGEFPEITETECIMGIHMDYNSGILVRNETDVETVFNVFIRYSQENNLTIFGDAYGNNWRFENATIHGIYQGIKYWKITASWFSEENQKWHKKTIFDVSERGEVVRLLGCI